MSVIFAAEEVRADEAAEALRRYFEELATRFPEGYDVDRAIDEVGSLLTPPAGVFVLARERDHVVGCGGIHLLDAATAEVRRMWVDPSARGRGVGRALLSHLELRAAEMGCEVVVLDTHSALVEAVSLYRSAGYEPMERYNDNPSAHFWFRKRLDPSSGTGSTPVDG